MNSSFVEMGLCAHLYSLKVEIGLLIHYLPIAKSYNAVDQYRNIQARADRETLENLLNEHDGRSGLRRKHHRKIGRMVLADKHFETGDVTVQGRNRGGGVYSLSFKNLLSIYHTYFWFSGDFLCEYKGTTIPVAAYRRAVGHEYPIDTSAGFGFEFRTHQGRTMVYGAMFMFIIFIVIWHLVTIFPLIL
jgi:hypothetical protein